MPSTPGERCENRACDETAVTAVAGLPPPRTLLPGAIAIDEKASPAVQAEAKKFVEFVLSKRGQKVMQSGDPSGESLYYPVVKDVKPRLQLAPHARHIPALRRDRQLPAELPDHTVDATDS